MKFEWDDAKNESNRKKHGVSFERQPSYSLIRMCTSSSSAFRPARNGGTHFLAGNQATRIISTREATPRERSLYAEAIF